MAVIGSVLFATFGVGLCLLIVDEVRFRRRQRMCDEAMEHFKRPPS
jgi:hypothetical protein